ncbi:MAG: hypothetical protein DMF49_01810 [Acidobacteria bacterium]|nr:MAG: hypothetical protein DMF49_01810 [Acidobacteriota bacterium]
MTDTIRRVDYYTVEIPDTPGEGFRILSALKQAGVNLLAYCGFPVEGGRAQFDFVAADDGEKLRKGISGLGLKLSGRKMAFYVQGDDRPGAIAEIVGKLANEEINLTAAQALCAGSNRYGMILWVKPSDYERAARCLGV